MNRKVRINSVPADYYRGNDIPGMPDFAGTWVLAPERDNFVLDITCQDLDRWLMEPYEWQDRNEVRAWQRQIAALKQAQLTDEPESEPANRAGEMRRREELLARTEELVNLAHDLGGMKL